MGNPSNDDLDPAAARAITKVRTLMLIATITTFVAVAAVFGVIAYRLFHWQESAQPPPKTPANLTAMLPKGAHVLSTAAANDRIVVTIEVGGQVEIRTFDLQTLKPTGRLRLGPEP